MADGKCIFQGETGAMVPYLESVGLTCPRHHNPADFSKFISCPITLISHFMAYNAHNSLYGL